MRSTWARGVTLIEMMIVLAIVGVIAAIAVPNLLPMITVQRVAVSAEAVANTLDRARRKAMVTGFCHRVLKVGNDLVVQRRTTPNCVTLDTTNWDTTKNTGRATPENGVVLTIEATSGSLPATDQLVFRPNGRLYGDNATELNVADDGGRVLVTTPSSDRVIDVRVQSNGRICAVSYTGTETMPNPVVCGVGYGTSTAGNPSCSAAGGAELPSFAALLGGLLLRRRRHKPSTATKSRARKRGKRGYLMLEVMASGAILAVILTAAITSVAQHRIETTRAARRAEAAGYAQQALAWVMAKMPPTCTGVPTAPSMFTVACTVTDVTPVSTPPLDEQMYDIEIVVTYPEVSSGNPVTTTHTARVRSREQIYIVN